MSLRDLIPAPTHTSAAPNPRSGGGHTGRRARPAIPAATTTSNIVAIKRQILLPLNPWAVAYATDPLIRELETLFAKHAAPRMGATALLRLNGELCAL